MTREIGPSAIETAERVLRQNWLEGERADGAALRLHAAEPRPLPVAVVLGLVLRGDRLAALRPRPGARRAGEPARRPARGRLHRPHDLLGPQGLADPAALLQRALAQRLPDRDDPAAAARLGLADRGRRPGRGAADRRPDGVAGGQSRPRGRRAALDRAARRVGPRRLAEVRPGLGPAGELAGSAFRCWCGATAGSASTRGGFASSGGPVLCEVVVNTLWSLSLQALGRPSATPALVDRLWDERRGAFLDEAQPGGERPADPHLRGAGAAGAARPARGDRPAPGRGAPARTGASS